MVAAKIAPSMLSADFANLASEAERILNCGADWLHMDIMDGQFVPSFSIGAPVVESLRKHTKAYLDCHLLVTNPLDYVDPLGKAGASGFTFHVEVSKDNWQELVKRINLKGMKPGVALKPGTPIEEVYPLVEGETPVELVLVMTVEPGFGGEKFMPEMVDKVRALRKKYPSLDIEVDGGLGPSTIDMAASAGANCIVAGSSVFGASEPAQVISLMRNSVEKAQARVAEQSLEAILPEHKSIGMDNPPPSSMPFVNPQLSSNPNTYDFLQFATQMPPFNPPNLSATPLTQPVFYSQPQYPYNIPPQSITPQGMQNKIRPPNWKKDEDEALCKSWLHISEEPVAYTNDKKQTLWERIHQEFVATLRRDTGRLPNGLMHRWSTIQADITKFSACIQRIEAAHPSGFNAVDKVGAIKQLYYDDNGHQFKYEGCWLILKDSSKWQIYTKEQQEKRNKNGRKRKESAHTIDLDAAGVQSDSSTPRTTCNKSATASSFCLDDDNSPLQDPTPNELVRSPGRKAGKTSRYKTKSGITDDVAKELIDHFTSITEKQNALAKEDYELRAEARRMKIASRERLEQAKLAQEKRIADEKLEKEIMMTDPSTVPTDIGKAWFRKRQAEILARLP